MVFQQFYLGCLSHASYLIGSDGTAAVVDPQRDVGIYLELARERGLSIAYVIETHLHADFVSGHRELAALTGAHIYVGSQASARFAHVAVHDGDELSFGRCRLKFLETPGHSLDSISILVTDLDRSPDPFAVLTGDTLFIGDVGRPDLAKGKSAEEMARLLYRSLRDRLLILPDAVEVYPAHGAGSLCGRQLSSETRSTIGKEKATNYALRAATETEFVHLVTSELPERPGYFALDKEINRAGAQPLSELPALSALRPGDVVREQENGAVVLDTRPASQFASGHVPDSMHIGLSGQFAVWAGALLGLDTRVILLAESPERVAESRVRLARVGIESVIGYMEDGIAGWAREGMPLEQTRQIAVAELAGRLESEPDSMRVVDVRRPAEWAEGHIEQATLVPLLELSEKAKNLGRDQAVAVYCKGGYRSAIAAGLLERAGFRAVFNVIGGFDAWRACDLPYARAQHAVG